MNAAKAMWAYRQTYNISLRKMAKELGVNFLALRRFEQGDKVEAPVLAAVYSWLLKQTNNKRK